MAETACPTLNALLLACAGPLLGEPWDAWYYGTRLVLADWLEDRDAPGDRLAASLVRQARPVARAEFALPASGNWRDGAVHLERRGGRPGPLRVTLEGHASGDDGWSRLDSELLLVRPKARIDVAPSRARGATLGSIRVSAFIEDESELSVALTFLAWAGIGYQLERHLSHHVARRNCRREVLGFFKGVDVWLPPPWICLDATFLVPTDVAPGPATAVHLP